MSGLPPLRDVIARHDLRAKKALGQNFLLDTQLLAKIAAIPGALNGELVYEVGPGPGGLTRALLAAGAHVTAVEQDHRCIAALQELAGQYPGQLELLTADAMTVSETSVIAGKAHVVANLPYNIGTALLVRWLTCEQWPPWWKSLTLMFQQEVAERIIASPDSSAYGRLAILCQWRSSATLAMRVHRSAFVPPPKVMSAVVHLTPNPPVEGVAVKTIEALTQKAFGQRRKMLRQSLKSIPQAVELLKEIGIDPQRRAETLAVEDFVALARALDQAKD